LLVLGVESSSNQSRILLLRREMLCPLCFPGFFLSSAFFLLRLASAAAASAVPTGATASGEHEHTRPAPSSSPSPSFLSRRWTASFFVAPALACSNLEMWLIPLLAAAGARRGYTSGAPTTPRRMRPHEAGGADPVLRRAADAAERGGRGDGLGCA
jgi:hypothetical protein